MTSTDTEVLRVELQALADSIPVSESSDWETKYTVVVLASCRLGPVVVMDKTWKEWNGMGIESDTCRVFYLVPVAVARVALEAWTKEAI